MSVNPGFGGQKFMPEVLNKVKQLKKIQSEKNMSFDIEIDGGINFDNCQLAIEAGANILVSGTTVFKSNNGKIKKNINLLKKKLYFTLIKHNFALPHNGCRPRKTKRI